ncbi:hypothetical protein ITJ43_11460 [Microbacterium sp. VKM Ac-2870]|uniref:hypothetical protein n=1 Tax=Microbacterium sp. VKM Ac-2870 TaxID=2783825 RepID=UPI00188C8094|nr:hypothetical protein [Microbacterium sp. VKM Ac-2870]MBF4562757.1 hypothetical protein [Microbacterium sp. VKM Ac-2870]
MSTASLPQLRFRLPGEWISLDPRDEVATREHITIIAREIVGPRDDAAVLRRRVRSGLEEAAAAARAASAHLLLMCREVAPGVATPVAITVHTPITITPAVGTAPDAVMRAFEMSLPHTDEPDLGTAIRVDAAGSAVLRLHAVSTQTIEEDGQTSVHKRLVARYWYTVPGHKQVALVQMSTPLGDLPHAMLRLFDAIVAGSAWADAGAPEPARVSRGSAPAL